MSIQLTFSIPIQDPYFANWKKDTEPNDYEGNEDYAVIFATGDPSGEWNDVDNRERTTLCWQKKPLESTTVKICEEGWEKHSVGGEDYCFQIVGQYSSDQGKAVCQEKDATLPLPTSSAQNEDLRLLMRDVFGLGWIVIGVTDEGSRFFIFRLRVILT